MDIDELRQKQTHFEGKRVDDVNKYKGLEELQKQFVNTFPQLRIPDLQLDDYVEGKSNTNSFCYWVEVKTKLLGDMRGSTALKFGIYFDKKTETYQFKKKYKTPNQALNKIKEEIVKLIKFGEEKDLNKIKKIELSPMFKAKILFLYFPDKFINIFSEEYVNYYLKCLGKFSENMGDVIDKREMLYQYKMSDTLMSNWKMWEFSDFLQTFGKPLKKESTPAELKPYIDFDEDYPNINDVKSEFIDLKIDINPNSFKLNINKKISKKPKIVDFEKEHKRNKRLGERGELMVFNSERDYLNKAGKANLASKVNQISKEDISAGYDILSFELDGRLKYIEVKSTSLPPSELANFIITANEIDKSKKLDNFYIYIVFKAKTKNPKIWKLENPFVSDYPGLIITPLNFRVEIYIS